MDSEDIFFWQIVEENAVSVFYTAPTAIRAFMKWGSEWPQKHDVSSLRLLGTVGEPINPEAWMWYHKYIGITRTKPGSATRPFPGIDMEIRSGTYNRIGRNGAKTCTLREMEQREMRMDISGYWGDVMNVSGHRISTMEVESALVDHPAVVEFAVVSTPHTIKGEAFVTLEEGQGATKELEKALKEHVARKIGPIARENHAPPPERYRLWAGVRGYYHSCRSIRH